MASLPGIAQQDTTARNSDRQTYQLVGLNMLPISEISAFHDYEKGITAARKLAKPALIYFNAYGAIPARRFDGQVLSKPEIKKIIDAKFQLIVLFVDDPTPLPVEQRTYSKPLNRTMTTVGHLNGDIQIGKFGEVRQPTFFIVDPTSEKKIHSILAPDAIEFRKFLTQKITSKTKVQ